MFEAYRMIPLQYTSKTVGTAESNISKWAKGEALIVEKAATHVSKDLLKNFRLKPWFPLAEKKLHTLFRAKRKRGLKVSTLWLCVTMAALIRSSTPMILGPKRLPRLGASSESGRRNGASPPGGGATRRTRA